MSSTECDVLVEAGKEVTLDAIYNDLTYGNYDALWFASLYQITT